MKALGKNYGTVNGEKCKTVLPQNLNFRVPRSKTPVGYLREMPKNINIS